MRIFWLWPAPRLKFISFAADSRIHQICMRISEEYGADRYELGCIRWATIVRGISKRPIMELSCTVHRAREECVSSTFLILDRSPTGITGSGSEIGCLWLYAPGTEYRSILDQYRVLVCRFPNRSEVASQEGQCGADSLKWRINTCACTGGISTRVVAMVCLYTIAKESKGLEDLNLLELPRVRRVEVWRVDWRS
jgi:hypothetical protein